MAGPLNHIPVIWPFVFWWTIVEDIFGFGPRKELMDAIEKDIAELDEKWRRRDN